MASIGIHPGGKLLHPPSSLSRNNSNLISPSNSFLTISSNTKKIPKRPLSASITSSNSPLISPPPDEVLVADSQSEDRISSQKIDSWMKKSVSDIVKNLKQAPLLVQIYSENDSENGRVEIHTEKALEERWPVVNDEWRSGGSRPPDGLIFVGELEQTDCDPENLNQGFSEGVTKAWGIVVQGKEVECGPACYLLKTNKVCAGMGLGFCTHFCLMRVNNFRDSPLEQFKDSWLLQ